MMCITYSKSIWVILMQRRLSTTLCTILPLYCCCSVVCLRRPSVALCIVGFFVAKALKSATRQAWQASNDSCDGLVTTTFLPQQQFPVCWSSASSAIFAHCWRRLLKAPSHLTTLFVVCLSVRLWCSTLQLKVMHIVAKAYEVTLCGNDLQTLHTILLPTDTALSPAYPSVMLHIAFKTLHLAAKSVWTGVISAFQPSCTHSFLLLAHSTILSFVCRLSVTLCTVVKATCCKNVNTQPAIWRHGLWTGS